MVCSHLKKYSLSPRSKGFTLIELLVVIVIIGVLVSMAALSIGGDHTRDQTREEAMRFQALIELALQETILNSRETGLELIEDGYRFLYFDDEQWAPIANDPILRARQLADGVIFNLESEDSNELNVVRSKSDDDEGEDEEPVPSIFILSSGEVTPFEALFTHQDGDAQFTVTGDFQGNVEVKEREQL